MGVRSIIRRTQLHCQKANGIDKLNRKYRESMERQLGFDTILLDAKAAY
jgi:hypothetical protein